MTTQPPQDAPTRHNPYIGPRAFQTGEKLFGRDYEVHELINLLIAERIVLLHSPSGAGKSSLIQAGLIPQLAEENFAVLPVIRVNLALPDIDLTAVKDFNRYIYSTLMCLEECLAPADRQPPEQLACLTLPEYLANDRARRACCPPPEGTEEQISSNLALIFDQFEEILTIDPNDRAGKMAFFNQVGEALRDRSRWALFAMREDYLAALTPYLRPVPTHLSNTYRLNFLDVNSASDAIREPVRLAGAEFEKDAALQLVDDLRKVQVQQPDGTFRDELGLAVEPLQLQVVCYRLWENLAASENHIDLEDVKALGDVNKSLSEYYNHCVGEISQGTGVNERTIRAWFQEQLITAGGIRGQVLLEPEKSRGLDNRAVRLLENTHLIRAEKRGGATWYELSHDRLIRPVIESNKAWFDANLSLLQKQAALWDAQGRPEALLIDGSALEEAETWSGAHTAEITPTEQRFLKECHLAIQREDETRQLREQALLVEEQRKRFEVEAQRAEALHLRAEAESKRAEAETKRAETEARRAEEQAKAYRRQRRLLIGLAFAMLIAVGFAIFANSQFQSATQARQLAETNSAIAVHQLHTAVAAGRAASTANAKAFTANDSAAKANAQATISVGEATSSAALASIKRLQVTEQAVKLGAYATQQVQEVTRAAPTPTSTAVVMVDQGRSLELAQNAVNLIEIAAAPNSTAKADLGLLLAARAYQSGATFQSRSALLTGVVTELRKQQKTLGLSLFSKAQPNSSLAFNPDGSALAARSGSQVNLWDVYASLQKTKPVQPNAQPQPAESSLDLVFYDASGNLVTLDNPAVSGRGPSASPTPVDGLSVSQYNQKIDWSQHTDLPFVYARATDGTTGLDGLFPDNWYGLKAAGILRGAYHFFRFDQDPIEQANHFLDAVSLEPGDLPPMLDIEVSPGETLPSNYEDRINEWLKYIDEQTGMAPILYFNPTSPDFQALLTDPAFQDNLICVALFTENPDPNQTFSGSDWAFWHYTDKGQVSGLSGEFDMLRFNGSLADLRWLAYASAMRDLVSGKILHVFPDEVNNTTASPAGDVVAYQDSSNQLVIADTLTYKDLPVPGPLAEKGVKVLAIGSGAQAIIANTSRGTQIIVNDSALPLRDQKLTRAVISPDNHSAAGLINNGKVVVYDLSNPTNQPYTLTFPGVTNMAFNPSGNLLAMGSTGGSIYLWDLENRRTFADSLPGHTGGVTSLAFSPKDDVLASTGRDGQVLLWDLRSSSLVEKACGLAGRDLTQDEWNHYMPGTTYQATCQ